MRRSIAVAAFAAAVLVHGPAYARATATVRARTVTTAPASSASLAPSPLTLTFAGAAPGDAPTATLRPGSSTALHLTATNTTSSDRLDVDLISLDATLASNGTVSANAATSPSTVPVDGASTWLGLGDTRLVLAPGASVDVPLTITAPPEAAGGTVAAAVRATVSHVTAIGRTAGRDDRAMTGTSATVGVRIDVQAPQRAELNITSVSVVQTRGVRHVRIAITNKGTTSAPVTGTLTIAGVATPTPLRVTVPPRDQATVEVPWPSSVPTSRLASATVSIHHGADNAEWSGQIDPSTQSATITRAKTTAKETGATPPSSNRSKGMPLWLLGAIAIAILWLGYEVVAAGKARRAPVVTPLVGAGVPFVDSGAAGRLQEELEPLVAAIKALAQTIDPKTTSLPVPDEVVEMLSAPVAMAPEPEPEPDLFAAVDSNTGDDDVDWVDADDWPTPINEPYIDADDWRAAEPELEIPEFVATNEFVAMAERADEEAAALQELRPWEPQDVVTHILDILQRIDPRPMRTTPIDDDEPIEVLAPDDLVDAVASALTVAPATVRHWMSQESLDATTRAAERAPRDPANLIREHQVLVAQVEVLKRALSDLG